jgi:GMP synthase-like glutamine amidotransferase
VLRERGYRLATCLVPEDGLPGIDFDFLLVMGGPMSVNDPAPWIAKETAFIRGAIAAGKPVLGICLGSQFIAKALGGTVGPGPGVEVGLTALQLTEEGRADPCFAGFPVSFDAVAWHGEGIMPPPGCRVLASSPLFPVQALGYGHCCYGLLFHLEVHEQAVAALCERCPGDLVRAGTSREEVMADVRGRLDEPQARARALLEALVDQGLVER